MKAEIRVFLLILYSQDNLNISFYLRYFQYALRFTKKILNWASQLNGHMELTAEVLSGTESCCLIDRLRVWFVWGIVFWLVRKYSKPYTFLIITTHLCQSHWWNANFDLSSNFTCWKRNTLAFFILFFTLLFWYLLWAFFMIFSWALLFRC